MPQVNPVVVAAEAADHLVAFMSVTEVECTLELAHAVWEQQVPFSKLSSALQPQYYYHLSSLFFTAEAQVEIDAMIKARQWANS